MASIGIDIGGTNTKLGLIDAENGLLLERSFKTQKFVDGNRFANHLIIEIEHLINAQNVDNISGIGIGAPGVDDQTSTIVASENIKWLVNFPLKQSLIQYFEIPVELINDANASAIGEMKYGVSRSYKNLLHITLGTGLGGCVVIDGKIIRGMNGMAGEIGHANAVPSGRPCNCGKVGCLENYVSGTGVRKTALEFLDNYSIPSSLREIDKHKLSAWDISEAAKKNDKLALKIFQYTGDIFGRKLAEFVSLLDPEAIILSGGLAASGDLLTRPTEEALFEALPDFYNQKVVIKQSSLDHSKAAVLGAATMLISDN